MASVTVQVVPWFDKQEWEQIYSYAYSTDPSLHQKAYQQMTVWSARVSELCMGVECTQTFLHIRICEEKKCDDGSPAFKDVDLQPMYSIAILRFLNHLQGLCDSKMTLYQIAEKYCISDWIVNMRHETAHGNKLPSLGLLRDAANFIYDWLNRNYWQKELSKMVDVVLEPPEVFDKKGLETELQKLLEIWRCVKLYQLGDYGTIQNIPNAELREAVFEVKDACTQLTFNPKKGLDRTSKSILQSIFQIIQIQDINKDEAQKCLVSQLLSNHSFLPSVTLQRKYHKTAKEILLNIWEEVVVEIQKRGLMLALLRALLEVANDPSDSRHLIAALWINCLVLSLKFRQTNSNVSRKSVMYRVLEQLSESLSSCFCTTDNVESIVKNSFKDFKQLLPLQPLSSLGSVTVQQFVKEALLTPSENTSLFISELLDLWEPPLDVDNKYKLCRLVKLYTKEVNFSTEGEDSAQDVLSLETLCSGELWGTPILSFETKEDGEDEMSFVDCSEGNWTVYSGEENWSKYALGRTPWQKQNFLHILTQDDTV